jgi:Putative adhesin
MRRPLITIGSLITIIFLAYGSLMIVTLISRNKTSSSVRFEGVKSVKLRLGAGSIKLIGTDATTVTGTRAVVRSLRKPTFSEKLIDDGVLEISTSCAALFNLNCSVDYDLRVPSSVSITGSSSGGEITVSGTDGNITVSSSGGGIATNQTSGNLVLDSSGGGIRAAKSSGSLELSSSGGGIRVTQSTSGAVRADSSGGGVRLEFDREPVSVTADSSGGGVSVVVPRSAVAYNVSASSSGGGENVEVKTDPDSDRRIKVNSSGGGVSVRYREK